MAAPNRRAKKNKKLNANAKNEFLAAAVLVTQNMAVRIAANNAKPTMPSPMLSRT
jgi:hypothetical protein